MLILENFSEYTPAGKEELKRNGVKFIRDSQGNDWYDSQKDFSPETSKIVFISQGGMIVDMSCDVTQLWPLGKLPLSVAEIPFTEQDLRGKIFDVSKNLVTDQSVDLEKNALRKIANISKSVRERMAPLQAAKELGIITEEEQSDLIELQKYLVDVSRLHKQKGFPDVITWPKDPQR